MIDVAPTSFSVRSRVRVAGTGERTLLFAHGFCSTQQVFDRQVEEFSPAYQVVTYDLAGFGSADPGLWDPQRHATLEGYAQDLVELLDELDLRRVTFVGASMSAMTGLLASLMRPERFDALVFVAGSPRYLDDDGYVGGFDRAALDGFYALVGGSVHWRGVVTDMLLNLPGSSSLQDVAQAVECVTPEVARVAARTIFESDYRPLLRQARHPVLVLQTRVDAAVPEDVGRFMAEALPEAELAFLPGIGHLPMRTQPEAFNEALQAFVSRTG